ncbi:hypothetical protein Taro_038132 [Colocasia esculenta]|uniref:Uncharacterized protein n=1 Tax=Colocasia esculenta TaxID=4460 RepID=A0A843WBW7_COLES|nr:hypothetical protein [Colocasia esculenta]
MMATWSDEDEDENAEATSGDDEVQCLMESSNDSNEVRFYSRHVPKTRFKRSRKIRKASTCRQPERSLSIDANRPARHASGQECLSTAAVSLVDSH